MLAIPSHDWSTPIDIPEKWGGGGEERMRSHYSFHDGQLLHDNGTVLTSAAVTAVRND